MAAYWRLHATETNQTDYADMMIDAAEEIEAEADRLEAVHGTALPASVLLPALWPMCSACVKTGDA